MFDDLYTIAALTALLALSVGITILLYRRKPALSLRGATDEDPAASPGGRDPASGEATATRAISVNFNDSGEQHPWDPAAASLLEFAESRDIAVESQCRAGECGSCRTKVLEGEVEYVQEPSISPGRGHCLLCVCVPKSDLTLAR